MKKIAASALVPLAVIPHHAFAQDAPAAGAGAWTGFHLGVGAGYDWSDLDVEGSYDYYCGSLDSLCSSDYDADRSLDAAIAVLDAGADYQILDNLVVGIGGDFTVGAGSETRGSDGSLRYEAEIGNTWSVYSRLGFAFNERFLAYGLVGWTHAQLDQKLSIDASGVDDPFSYFTGDWDDSTSSSEWLNGLTLGAGLETMLNANVSLKVEYRHTALDGSSVNLERDVVLNVPLEQRITATGDLTMQSIRATVSYRF